jgi:hypothetical protein
MDEGILGLIAAVVMVAIIGVWSYYKSVTPVKSGKKVGV